MRAGDIWFDLRLEDGQFTARARGAEGVLRELRRNLSDTAESTKKLDQHFGSLSTGFRNFMLTAGSIRFALMDFRDLFLALPLSIIKTSGEIERMTKLMEGLSTATDKVADAKKSRNFVFDMAQNSPFEVKALTDAFVKFKSGGIDPMNGSMKALVDSVAKFGGTSDQLHRASIAIQQMGGKGVISMEELRQQLGEAVPDAINMMAIGVGKSMSELVKAISNGEVESKSALDRMFAVMAVQNYGAAAKMMDTWTGMIEQLKTKWELFKNTVGGGAEGGQGVFSEARKEVKLLLEAFDGSVARKFGADLSEAMYEVANALSGLVQGVVQHYEEIKNIGSMLVTAFVASKILGGIGAVKAGIVGLMASYNAAAASYIAAERAKMTAETEFLMSQKQRHVLSVVMMGEEVTAKQAQVVALNAVQSEALAFQLAAQKLADTGRSNGKIISNEARASAAALAQAHREVAAAATLEGNALHSQAQVLRQNIVATQALIAEKNILIDRNLAAGTSATVAGRQMAGLGGVFQAVGGWVTVLTGVLMAAVWAWDKFGNAAEKNAELARRAANKMSTVEDKKSKENDVTKLEEWFKNQDKLAASRPLSSVGKDSPLYKQKLKELEDAKGLLKTVNDNLLQQSVQDSVQSQRRYDELEIKGRTDSLIAKKDKLNKAFNDSLTAINSNTSLSESQRAAETKKIEGIRNSGLRDIGKDIASQEISHYLLENKKLEKELKTAGKERAAAIRAITEENNARISDAINKSNKNDLIATDYVHVKGKKAGKDGKSGGTAVDKEEDYSKKLFADLEKAKVRWKNVLDEAKTFDSLRDEAIVEIQALIDTDKIGKKLKGKMISKPTIKDMEDEVNALAMKKLLERASKEMPKLESEAETLRAETEAIMTSITNGTYSTEKDQKEEHALIKLIKDIETRSGVAVAELEPLKNKIKEVLELGKGKDAAVSTRDYLSSTDKTLRELNRAREYANAPDADSLRQMKNQAELEELEESYKKKLALTLQFSRERKEVEERYAKLRSATEAKHLAEYKTPMQTLLKDWTDVGEQMKKATASWTQSSIESINKFVMTGKGDFKSLVVSILSDISKMTLQKSIGGLVGGVMDKAGALAMSAIGATQTAPAGGSDAEGAASAGMNAVASSSGILQTAMDNLRTNGIGATLSAMIQQMFTTTTQVTQTALVTGELGFMSLTLQSASSALVALTSAANAAAAAQSAKTASAAFANGGIMSSSGSLPLKMYANGGIATSPQLAIFGEGSMNEAYVPLPDGRSIPVTMSAPAGAGGSNVTIQINVSNGGSSGEDKKSTTGTDTSGAWGQLANRIKGVVQEEIVKQKRPGGVLFSG